MMSKYGFRYDPMTYVENDESVQAALVRTLVFDRSNPGDEEKIEARFQKVFAKQNADGSLEDEHDQGVLAATSEELRNLLEAGCPSERPEVQRAVVALRKALDELPPDKLSDVSCYAVRVLCELGVTDHPAIEASLLKMAAEIPDQFGEGCPWTPFVQLNALWTGRNVADVSDAIEQTLAWAEEAVTPAGCSAALGLCVPWSLVLTAVTLDHPACERIARTLVPMMLRLQKPDGGWGEPESNATLRAFKMLKKYDLLDKLRALPLLPPDWRVVNSIPAPCEKPWNIAWDNGRLWVHDAEASTAIAVSPDDGAVLQTVPLPKKPGCTALGAWDGALWVLPGKSNEPEKTLYRIDPSTEQTQETPLGFSPRHFAGLARIGDKVLIADQWVGCVWAFDPADPSKAETLRLAAGMADWLATDGKEIWALDSWVQAVVRTNIDGDLLDWGELPFGWGGIAFDGQHLWAIDKKNQRICAVEKAQ
jgi:sugar lactone lactonase YvrE